jgi:DNA-binding MarR family transcriptional regulator
MKKKLRKYTFNRLEIKILKEVARGNHSLYLLKKFLVIKPNLLSYNLKKLLQKGLIKVEKKEKRLGKYVYFDNSKHALLFRELLLRYDHIKWENILSGLAIDVLFQTIDKSELTFKNFSKATFWRYMRDLMSHGMITRSEDDFYEINPRFSILKDFLIEYQRFLLDAIVRSVSASAVILWQKDLECLIRVPKDVNISQKSFLRTAVSRFNDFGLPLITDFDIYFYSSNMETIRVEDVILHTLLIERDNPRYTLYGLLLLKKQWRRINKKYLLKEAQTVDLGLQLNAMFQFLKTQGVRRGLALPTWEEYLAKAKEYKVTT